MTELDKSFGRVLRLRSVVINSQVRRMCIHYQSFCLKVVEKFKQQLASGDEDAVIKSLLTCENKVALQ